MTEKGMGKIYSAEILCVGTELLMGQIVNTNAAYIARELVLAGIPSYRQSVVGDNPGRLAEAILLALGRSDAVILTGGLGPTEDDITMAVAAETAGRKLVSDADSADRIRSYFQHTGRTMPLSNLKQSFLPEGCIILPNNHGTAPGAIIETEPGRPLADPKVLVLLPGPPSEMRPMFDEAMERYLKAHAPVKIRSEFIKLFGIGESAAEQKIKDLIQKSRNPTVAPYCSEGECMFRISYTSSAETDDEGEDALAAAVDVVKERLEEYIYEIGSRTLPQVAFERMASCGATVSFAESCTGGMLGAAITDFPGSSEVYKGGVIVYSNQSKIQILDVPEDLIAQTGTVSPQTAESMAEGCRRLFDTDYAVAVSGIAGPGGGSEDKPVGLVYISLTGPEGTVTKELRLKGSRARIRRAAVLHVFDMLRRAMDLHG
ncbi:MAG: competence/damage-inducible protein A [Saccharofermentanales bacterium]